MQNRLTVLAFAALAAVSIDARAVPQPGGPVGLERDAANQAPVDDATEGEDASPRFRILFADAPAPDQDIKKDNCLRFTGSRLMRDDRPNQRCAHAAGYVLMRGDIDLDGAGTLADFVR
jgi:hypothetical protein